MCPVCVTAAVVAAGAGTAWHRRVRGWLARISRRIVEMPAFRSTTPGNPAHTRRSDA